MYALYKDPKGLKVFDKAMPSGNVGSSSKASEKVSGMFGTSSTNEKVSSEILCYDACVTTIVIYYILSRSGNIPSREIIKIAHIRCK